MLWTIRDFLSNWWRLFVWGKSWWGKAIKVTALMIALGVLPAVWGASIELALLFPDSSLITLKMRIGVLIGCLLAAVWGLLTLGAAYERSGAPELIVANELVYDAGNFRLFLTSKRKDFDTKVRLMDIVDANLNSLVPGRFPLELEWSHHPKESNIHLSAGYPESVSVAGPHGKTFGMAVLAFTGARHRGEDVALEVGESAYFHLSIQHPKQPIERWFRFERTGPKEFDCFSEAPPSLKLTAVPANSKHDS